MSLKRKKQNYKALKIYMRKKLRKIKDVLNLLSDSCTWIIQLKREKRSK